MDVRALAKYPFLSKAREYIAREAPPLEDILTNPLYFDIREKGFNRVNGALENGLIPTPVLLDEDAMKDEVLSYPLARMIVSVIGDQFLVARYSLAEAKSAGSSLERESVEFQIEVARDTGMLNVFHLHSLPFDMEKVVRDRKLSRDIEIMVHFSDYLRFASSFNSADWKMVNRELVSGFIALTRKNLVRLVEEALRLRLVSELPLPVNQLIVETLGELAKEIGEKTEEMKERFRDEDLGEFSAERFPPCVAHLISQIQANINLSHEGRFFLASFLFHVGLNMDRVVAVFSQSPDFDPGLARYQLEHIHGDISGTKYTPPSCSTLKTNGICYRPDGLCRKEWLTHPLTYYKIKGKKSEEAADKEKIESATEEKGQGDGKGEEAGENRPIS